LDEQATLIEQVKAAMTYPILVVGASVFVVSFMLVFIVPIFARIYAQFHAELPLITLFLVTLSGFILKWWFLTALGIIALVLAIKQWYLTEGGRHAIDAFKLKIPLVGKLLHKIAVAQFTNTWSGTTKGGIPIIGAMQV